MKGWESADRDWEGADGSSDGDDDCDDDDRVIMNTPLHRALSFVSEPSLHVMRVDLQLDVFR